MPRLPEQNEAIKDRRRAKLLDAATRSFALYGYDDTTIDTITKIGRCSHGLFYHYFPTKESMFASVYRDVILPSRFGQNAEVLNNLHGKEGLKNVCECVANAAKTPAKELRILLIIADAFCSEDIDEAKTDIKEKFNIQKTLTRYVEEGQAAGEIILGNPEEIACSLASLLFAAIERNNQFGPNAPFVSKEVLERLYLK